MKKEDLTSGVHTSSLVGMPIYTLDYGKRIGSVKDVLYDSTQSRLVGFTIEEPGIISPDRRILPFESVKSIGRDAVMVPTRDVLIPERNANGYSRFRRQHGSITDKYVISESGNRLGSISDVIVDAVTGEAVSYELTMGVTRDIGGGRRYVDADGAIVVGHDAVIISNEAERRTQEQAPGGIAGAYEGAKTKTSQYGAMAGDYTREQEANMARGRVAGRDVADSHGLVIVSKGEVITDDGIEHARVEDKLHDLALAAGIGSVEAGYGSATDSAYAATGAQLMGRVVPKDVVNEQGAVVIPAGTVVTDEVLMHARQSGVMGRLASIVLGEHAKGRAESVWGEMRSWATDTWSGISDSSREANERANRRKTVAEQKTFLKGKVSATDVSNDAGEVILREGEIITPLVLDDLDRAGKLEQVKLVPEGHPAEGPHDESEAEVHLIVETRQQHERHHKTA